MTMIMIMIIIMIMIMTMTMALSPQPSALSTPRASPLTCRPHGGSFFFVLRLQAS